MLQQSPIDVKYRPNHCIVYNIYEKRNETNCDDTTALDMKLMILMIINIIPMVFFVAICIGLFILMAVLVQVGGIFVVDVHIMTAKYFVS